MTLKRWYHCMLFMPLMMPVIIFICVAVSGYEVVMLNIGMLLRFLMICSLIGGIPYLFFALAVLWWGRHKTTDQWKKASWWLPWIFTPVCAVFFLAGFLYEYPQGDAVQSALIMAAFCVPVGFMYVIFVHMATRIARSLKLVKA